MYKKKIESLQWHIHSLTTQWVFIQFRFTRTEGFRSYPCLYAQRYISFNRMARFLNAFHGIFHIAITNKLTYNMHMQPVQFSSSYFFTLVQKIVAPRVSITHSYMYHHPTRFILNTAILFNYFPYKKTTVVSGVIHHI